MEATDMFDYLRQDRMTHILCPGCGHGTAMNAIIKAAAHSGLDKDKTVFVSGIGCSSRIPGYLDFNTLHTTHGRALTFATGVKIARPELKVIVIMGDGDATAIGGNHFIHAARRNIDLTAIILNNNIYGMTGGQYSPTTGESNLASTAPYGCIEPDFDICKLAIAAGASYVARGTAYSVVPLSHMIERAFNHKGFSVIDVISQCPTYFGRKNKLGGAVDMLKRQKEMCVHLNDAKIMDQAELDGKIVWGEFLNQKNRKEYTDAYAEIIARAQGRSV